MKPLPHDLLVRPAVNHAGFEVDGIVGVVPFVALFVFLTHGYNGLLLELVAVALRKFFELFAQRFLQVVRFERPSKESFFRKDGLVFSAVQANGGHFTQELRLNGLGL